MKYQCLSCKKTFIYASKQIITNAPVTYLDLRESQTTDARLKAELEKKVEVTNTIEHQVCPFCGSKEFDEFVEQKPIEEVSNVYIYELTNGPQTELDGLLNQGYKIVNRYSKQYHLEKPKLTEEHQ